MYKSDRSSRPDAAVSLQVVIDEVAQLIGRAEDRGEDDLADDLRSVESTLQAAVKAESDGKLERRLAKLEEARRSIQELVKAGSDLQRVLNLLSGVI